MTSKELIAGLLRANVLAVTPLHSAPPGWHVVITPSSFHPRGWSVLVINQHRVVNEVTERALQALGFEVQHDGHGAMEAWPRGCNDQST